MGSESNGKAEFQRPEMTAEEKKAQRAAKAAEKKARAEAAAQKKKEAAKTTSVPSNPPQKTNEVQKSPQAIQENNRSIVVTPPPSKESPKAHSFTVTPVQSPDLPPSSGRKPEKSMLKTANSGCRGEKTVKFDLSPDSAKTASQESLQNYGLDNQFPYLSISDVHPAFLTLALRCEKGLVFEVDELCVEFLDAFREFFEEWAGQRAKEETHTGDIGPDLSTAIRPQIGHLTENGKWALPAALGNIVRQLKREILRMDKNEKIAVDALSHWVGNCRKVSFELAYRGIADHLAQKLTSSQARIVTFGWYPAVEAVLLHSKDSGISCCVVDEELGGHGLALSKTLSSKGIVTQYTDLSGLSATVPKSSMILFGCSAVLSNGNVVSAKGSLLIALMAKAFNIPVLVLAQSFKFVDKVQSVGRVALLPRDSDEIIPADLVTALITDIRILPPTSAPAVLKIKALDME